MEEVLGNFYQDHRKNLLYKRRYLVDKTKNQSKVLFSGRKNQDANSIAKFYGKSLEITQKSIQKEARRRNLSLKNASLVSKREGQVLKKYIQSHGQKEVKLPRINNSIQIKSNSTRVEQISQHTLNSFQSSSKNFIIRRQKTRKSEAFHKNTSYRKKFKRCANAVLFIVRLKKKIKQNFLRFNKTLKLSQNLLKMIQKLVNKYYVDCLRQPLLTYEGILSKKVKNRNYNPSQNIVTNIMEFSQKLKQSSIRKDILDFLSYISIPNAFIPVDYFCEFEMLRLDFHPSSQQIGRVSQDQLKMIVGVFMGIKVLCTYVFEEPWNIKIFELNIKENQKKLKPLIWAYSSFFYWLIIQIFDDMKARNYKYVEKLMKKGWQPMLLHQESNQFFETVKKSQRKRFQTIKNNLEDWIERITLAVQKHRQALLE